MFPTYRYKLVVSITLVVLMFFSLACSEKNNDAPGYNKVHAEEWYNPQHLNSDVFHGTEVKRQGTSSCEKCHEIYSEGQEDIPGCFKCHFGPDGDREPMGSGWVHGLERHEDYQNDQAVCNSCHDLGRSFGVGPGICHNCHGSGEEHIMGQPWLDRDSPQFHGDQPQAECANCHNLSTDCYQCHFGPDGRRSPNEWWSHGTIDNHNDLDDFGSVCDRCHDLSRSYRGEPRLEPEGCHYCHDD